METNEIETIEDAMDYLMETGVLDGLWGMSEVAVEDLPDYIKFSIGVTYE